MQIGLIKIGVALLLCVLMLVSCDGKKNENVTDNSEDSFSDITQSDSDGEKETTATSDSDSTESRTLPDEVQLPKDEF